MPNTVPTPDGTVTGAWGNAPYPPWFLEAAQRNHMDQDPVAMANAFKQYVTNNPTYDFGQYWNQFRPGNPLADSSFGGQGGGNQEPPTNQAPPPQTSNDHVSTSMPTSPGGPEPGRWQRLVSFVNGQRRERWKWIPDPASAVHPPPQPPTQQPPVTTSPPATDPPVSNEPPVPHPTPNPGGWDSVQNDPSAYRTSASNSAYINPVRNALNPGSRPGMPSIRNNTSLPNPNVPNRQGLKPWQTKQLNQQNPNL